MKKEASHTSGDDGVCAGLRLRRRLRIGRSRSGWRGRSSEQLELFADRMREGLLAASVAIGLDVMGELVEAEVRRARRAEGDSMTPGRSGVPAWQRGRAR